MATDKDIQVHYDGIAALHPLRMNDEPGGQGRHPDYSCAFFNGQFGKSYAQAQADKYSWIFDGLGLGQELSGKRVLDLGCGWGPMLNATRERGGHAIGLTLSPGQVNHCQNAGLEAVLKDYKTLKVDELGVFDGIVSVGAFEHFCSPKEQLEGKQEKIYRDFFKICSEHLRPGGGLFLQTMTWGRDVPDYHKVSLKAPKESRESILARIEQFYPGTWLPNGLDQLVNCAKEHFDYVTSSNGRLDYIETLKRWDAATSNLWKPRNLPKTVSVVVPLALQYVISPRIRIQVESIRRGDQRTCFVDEIMSHERIFFTKKALQ